MSADQEVLNLDHKETSSLLSVQNQISGAWGWQGECFAWEKHTAVTILCPHYRNTSTPGQDLHPKNSVSHQPSLVLLPHSDHVLTRTSSIDQLHPWKPKSKCSTHWPQPFLLLDHLLWLYLFLTSLKRPLLWLPFLPHLLTYGAYTRQRDIYVCFYITYISYIYHIYVFAYHIYMFLHVFAYQIYDMQNMYAHIHICIHTYNKFFFLEKAIQFKGLYSFLNIVYPFLFFFTF